MSDTWESDLKSYQIDPELKAEVREKFHFRPFKQAPATTVSPDNLAGLDAIDLAQFKEGPENYESRKKLADQLESSLTKNGFFKIVNFGVSPEEIEQLLSISQGTFDEPQEVRNQFIAGEHNLPEEKDKPVGPIRGSGYKPIGHWKWDNDTKDNIDIFNFRHFTHYDTFFNRTAYPEFVQYNLDDIAHYFNHIHHVVLRKISTLLDIILELPEGSFYERYFKVKPEEILRSPDGIGRFLLYYPVDKTYKESAHDIWMKGHTDSGALTFILSQPILSLQICDHETGEWRYVSHTPGALVVNVSDEFEQLTGGYFKSSVHRVVTPPPDQAQYCRNTVIYFSNTTSEAFIEPDEVNSPKLKRLGIKTDKSIPRLTGAEWMDAKGQYFNQRDNDWHSKENILGRESIGTLEKETPPQAVRNAA